VSSWSARCGTGPGSALPPCGIACHSCLTPRRAVAADAARHRGAGNWLSPARWALRGIVSRSKLWLSATPPARQETGLRREDYGGQVNPPQHRARKIIAL